MTGAPIPRNGRAGQVRRLLWFLGIVAIYTVVAIPFGAQNYLAVGGGGAGVWWRSVLLALSWWHAWALLTPLILVIARRFRFERDRTLRAIVVHALASLAIAPLHSVIGLGLIMVAEILFEIYSWNPEYVLGGAGQWIITGAWQAPIFYWAIVGLCNTFDYSHSIHARELEASRLEAELAQTQLQVLRMQLNPHFLFNTLNAVTTLMHRDVEAAERVLVLLSRLLRSTLESTGIPTVPLNRELEVLRRYLELEKVRFGGQLAWQFDVEPEVHDALVPNLILQPLVENAIRHGLRQVEHDGQVTVLARRDSGRLLVAVQDNGVGFGDLLESRIGSGVGLTNTRQRLERHYGRYFELDAADLPEGGAVVSLRIPLRWPDDER